MKIGNQPAEKEITLDDTKPFVTKQDVAPGNTNQAAYEIEGPDNYLIGLPAGALFAPEFRDSSGEKLDGSTRVTLQKTDKEGNLLGGTIAFNDLLSSFDYQRFRTDPDYFRTLTQPMMIAERERAVIHLDIPSASNGFSAADSRLVIGDNTSDFGTPVEIIDTDDLAPPEKQAVNEVSTTGGLF